MKNIKLIKKLRKSTGLGIMTCKKVLNKYKGNIKEAINYLLNIYKIKSKENIPNEGIIKIKVSKTLVLLMVELNCETDFVSHDVNFIRFVNKIANKGLYTNQKTIIKLIHDKLETDRINLVTKLNENIIVRNLILLNFKNFKTNANTIGYYNHKNRIGSFVIITNCQVQIAKDIAMQIIATNPTVIYIKAFANEQIKKEKTFILSKIKHKPLKIINKIIKNKLLKYLKEKSLVNQLFIKDPKNKISNYLSQNSKILKFFRFEIGKS
ncbi:Elongation factor Ts [Candidatus Portiera aleyrodidarum]|uniref:Elongation factor Ts n=1 Tax=Candidatus Portiera aleyrodidarum TaxID=91844 RepID=A0A6S6RR63_9GAMM|nr:translation elongation factor Ts [Candidatus Portiera aleyrodidarum]CAA3708561.1 Elongation factor Ts [Candidatus Portiera aleyrodidarum]